MHHCCMSVLDLIQSYLVYDIFHFPTTMLLTALTHENIKLSTVCAVQEDRSTLTPNCIFTWVLT